MNSIYQYIFIVIVISGLMFANSVFATATSTNDIWLAWYEIYGQEFFFLIFTAIILGAFLYAFIQFWL